MAIWSFNQTKANRTNTRQAKTGHKTDRKKRSWTSIPAILVVGAFMLGGNPALALKGDSMASIGSAETRISTSVQGQSNSYSVEATLVEQLGEELAMSTAQKKQFQDYLEGQSEARKIIHQQAKTLRQQLDHAAEAGENEAVLKQLAGQLGDLMAGGAMQMVQTHAYLKNLLTDEQNQQLQELRMQHQGAHERPVNDVNRFKPADSPYSVKGAKTLII
jgi:hypothetical protein